MKLLQKASALLLCVGMLIGLLPVSAFAASGMQFTIVADKTKDVVAGDEIKFTVTVESDTPCDQFGVQLQYDSNVFEVVSGVCSVSAVGEDGDSVVAIKVFDKGRGFVVSLLEAVTYSGKVGEFTLRVKENASFANTSLTGKTAANGGAKAISTSINEVTIFGRSEHITIDNIIWSYAIKNNEAVLDFCDPGVAVNITVPTTLAGYPVTAIAAGTFSACSELERVIIPEGVIELRGSVFSGCTALSSVTIPASLTSIGTNAFNDCTRLRTVYYSASKSHWNGISISDGNANLTNATIHYNHTHDYTMLPSIVVEGTCTQEGYTEYYCAYDPEDTYRVYVPALGHDYSRLIEKVEPTCLEGGYSVMGCVRCEEQITTDYVGALGHEYSRLVEKIDPTCTEDGYSVKSCCRCEETITTDYVPALGHHAVLIPMKNATCTEDGISRPGTMCDRCLVILVQPTVAPALGHDFVNGACSRCGDKDPNYLHADLNEDTLVDNGDVLTLLWHTLFPEQNPIAAPVDFNTDGKVDNDDVLTLLWHTLFPEQNPL